MTTRLRAFGHVLALVVGLIVAGLDAAQAQIAFRSESNAASAAPAAGIAYRGTGTFASRGNCGSITPSLPGGTVAGDLLVAVVVSGRNPTLSMAGWNTLFFQNPVGTLTSAIYWRIATGGDPTTITQSGSCNVFAARISGFSGVDTVSPFVTAPLGGGNWSYQNANTVTTGTETTALADTMLVVTGHTTDNDTLGGIAGYTQAYSSSTTTGNDASITLYYAPQAAAGTFGPYSASKNRGSDPNIGTVFALRPDPTASPGLTINRPAGTVFNDFMVASIAVRPCSNTSGGACTVTVTPPAGWTLLNSFDQTTGGGTGGFGNLLYVYHRVATGAEPANYIWTIGGAPPHAGAVGSIASFSGVDPGSPVVAAAGQLTPNGYAHDAPGIDTGIVTDTMLVSAHAANSAATWTPPTGMTEVTDVPSLPVPDALGISLEVNYEFWLPAGLTGTRTATHSNPPASDTGAAHLLALRPIPSVLPGGGFNAFETATPPGSTSGVIRTKIAGAPFNLSIVSLNPGGTIDTGYNRSVTVELLDSSNDTGALDTDGCRSTWTTIYTLSPNPSFAPPDNGRINVGPFDVGNAYPNVRVRITNATGPARRGCSTDNFAIRPASFASFSASDTNRTTAGTVRVLNDVTFGATVHNAGRPFSVRAFAVTAAATPALTTTYAGAPTANTTACAGAACTPSFGTLSLNTAFTAGQLVSDVATYTEVGSFSVQLIDDAFAAVDNADGSTLGERRIQSGVINVGRFVPDHFAVSLNVPSFATACSAGSFTYAGQAFGYAAQPVVTVAARNFANSPTLLYAGAWWRLTNASLTPATQVARYAAASGTLDASGLPPVAGDPVIADAGLGTGTLTFSAGTGLRFARSTPVAPFDADIGLSINVVDLDGVTAAAPASFGAATAGNGVAFSAGKEVRFGRLRLANGNGSNLVPLALRLEAQHWIAPGYFVTNTADSCTIVTSANVGLGNFQGGLTSGDTTPSIAAGPLAGGLKSVALSPPGAGKSGSVDVVLNLAAPPGGINSCVTFGVPPTPLGAGLSFLRGEWCTPPAGYDRDPTARGRFGAYRGSSEFIYFRENY